ncbi:hypothetical protein ACVWXU_006518 [Streptomyces sp. TE33382]
MGQSPVAAATLAWVLRLPLSTAKLTHEHAHAELATCRVDRTWAWWLMSRTTVVFVLVGSLLGTFLWSVHWQRKYCHGPLTDRNTDAIWSGSGEDRECVGVATSSEVRFAAGNSLELNGVGKGITFERIERAIRDENAHIGPNENYVTIVYAGPLTARNGDDKLTRKGLEELTGVYLRQLETNKQQPVKLRVLTANGGQDMRHQLITVDQIIKVAERDPTVVGVVGFGLNTGKSLAATKKLKSAGIALLDTTNSSGDLPTHSNYFGLAATDKEQTDALGLVAEQIAAKLRAAKKHKPRAIVLSRKLPKDEKDGYTAEQRDAGKKMLDASGFDMYEDVTYKIAGGARLNDPVNRICKQEPVPAALYFAGRAEDIPNLMKRLSETEGCSHEPMTVFTGDDLTKETFKDGTSIASNVTLYHSALAPLDKAAPLDKDDELSFYGDAHTQLGKLLPSHKAQDPLPSPAYDDGLFASGQTVMSYTATAALYNAASRDDTRRSAAETWATLHTVVLANMPTGTIILDSTKNMHGLNIIKVVRHGTDAVRIVLCGKAAGDPKPLDCKP